MCKLLLDVDEPEEVNYRGKHKHKEEDACKDCKTYKWRAYPDKGDFFNRTPLFLAV